ncbi:MAG TPA: arginase family protein [Steroidobacteraceae bacterium]|nr:arginase family protein [Steroidobacteraceae bacterium]
MPKPALIVYQGRAGDRNGRGTAGARVLGNALARRLNLEPRVVGVESEPLPTTLWDEQLSAARSDLRALSDMLAPLLADGVRCISAIGRCAAGLATVPAVVRHHGQACVVWFDAHGDSNLPSSNAVPYLGGMVITGAAGHWDSGLGSGLSIGNVVLVGARDLDPHEKQLITSGVLTLLPPGPGLAERLGKFVGNREVYVHLDCDVLEPGVVPLEYEVTGGLSLADLHACAVELARRTVLGVEIAEFESTWADGRRGDPDVLIDAIEPLLI